PSMSWKEPLLSLSRYFCPSIHHPPPFSLSCEFSRSNIEMIALSIDNLEDHRGWTKVLAESGCAFLFPIIADTHRMLAVGLAMLDHDEKDKDGIPLTATVDFSIGPDKRLKLSLFYLPTMAWNFDEILRVVDGQQLTAQNQLATPAEWQVSHQVSLYRVASAAFSRKYYWSNQIKSNQMYLYSPSYIS
uniref:Uncharacterized protein n=1 Tax=Oncorhynchus mykiss TaxID=8022 RepID=A0A8C7RPU3_ONCMY